MKLTNSFSNNIKFITKVQQSHTGGINTSLEKLTSKTNVVLTILLRWISGKQAVRYDAETVGSTNGVNGEPCSDSYEFFSFVTTESMEGEKKLTADKGTWKLFYAIHIVVFYIITSCSQLWEATVPKKHNTHPLSRDDRPKYWYPHTLSDTVIIQRPQYNLCKNIKPYILFNIMCVTDVNSFQWQCPWN